MLNTFPLDPKEMLSKYYAVSFSHIEDKVKSKDVDIKHLVKFKSE